MNFIKPFATVAFALTLVSCGDNGSGANDSGSNPFDSLGGKVWYVIGDSFSRGDIKANYPYLIGNRTGMSVQNIAVNGSTLSMYGESSAKQTFTHPQGLLYTTDFSKADYVTIYYGINDSYLEVPIGSIEDTVTTTFYGAFNIALEYLSKHYPKAKIGLIVSNACTTRDYPDATVAIAEKWGLPYLDLDGGVNCPTMLLSSSRNPASEEEKQEVLEQQRISETNYHPNEYAHQLESVCIEQWLRSW
ncbi:MAG: SGNH/GDSL hydrolase family protein [Fibrobacter sp.]|nr:SGNH/GDSL hydrolase family protein [Fibrobacter sp.]